MSGTRRREDAESGLSPWAQHSTGAPTWTWDDLLLESASPQPTFDVFWAPGRWTQPSDWVRCRGTEHLAVLVSRAIRSDNNVCLVSAAPSTAGRHAGVIGLIDREPTTWAINFFEGRYCVGDVRRHGYLYDNYDGFAALTAAEISWAWVTSGALLGGLTLRTTR